MAVTVSVVLASYNGAQYIQNQIESILGQLRQNDELIVTDDGSTDRTIAIVHQFVDKDCRVRFYNGPKQGVIENFAFGFTKARNDIIVPSDQDDIWKPDKIATLCQLFSSDKTLTCVLHDVEVVDENLKPINPSFFALRKSHLGLINNLIKNSYMGSAMAFRRSMLPYVLPIPSKVPMHDQWIGLINEMYGKTAMCTKRLGLYRRHHNNVSTLQHGSIPHMLRTRFVLIINLFKRQICNHTGD